MADANVLKVENTVCISEYSIQPMTKIIKFQPANCQESLIQPVEHGNKPLHIPSLMESVLSLSNTSKGLVW